MMDWQWSGTKKQRIRGMLLRSVIWAGCMQMAEECYKMMDLQWNGTKKQRIREMRERSVIWAGCMRLVEE